MPDQSRAISRLLNDIFDLEALNDLCFFNYRAVYETFQSHDRKQTRLRMLLEHVERRGLVDDLLVAAIEYAPHRKAEIEALRPKPDPEQAAPEVVIDHRAAIESFERLLAPDAPYGVLWLTGRPHMGKSHLLRKIFPGRAARRRLWAGLDLRNQTSIFNALQQLRSHLTPDILFPNFNRAYRELEQQAFLRGQQTATLEEFLSQQSRSETGSRRYDLHLTKQFVADLVAHAETPLIFLFDTLDDLEAAVPAWLLKTFLVQVDPFPHIRVVIGGRTPPPSVETYSFLYHLHSLAPVTDPQEYAGYCTDRGLPLSAAEIAEYIELTGYTPGLFVQLVENRQQTEAGYGT